MDRRSAVRTTLTLLFLMGLVEQGQAQESLSTVIKRIQPAVVTIIAYDANGKSFQQGSGFFITETDYLITNRHVLRGAYRAEVKTAEGKSYAIKSVVAEDKDRDLIKVVTDLPKESIQGVHIAKIAPEIGQRVIVVGSPLGLEQSVSDGIISAVRDIPRIGKLLQITAPISPGSSGSPVINLQGEVLGVATLQLLPGQNLNFAIPGEL